MKNAERKLLLLVTLLLACALGQTAFAQNTCKLPGKRSQLAMDQRDDVRLKCMKQKKGTIKIPECLSIAQAMEYSNNAEDARMVCLYDLKKQPTLNECITIAKAMEYPDSGDEARWECIRRYNRVITKKQCSSLAKNMSYPANVNRAQLYCANELL